MRKSPSLPGHLELDLMGRYVDTLPAFGIPSDVSLDVRLGWKPRENLEFAIVGQNLLDNHHPKFGTSPLVRSPLVEIERSIYGMVSMKW